MDRPEVLLVLAIALGCGCGRDLAPAPAAGPAPAPAREGGVEKAEAPGEDLTLRELLWERRPLLLFAPTAAHPELEAQRARLREVADALAERDMALIVVAGDEGAIDGRRLSAASVARLRSGFAPGADRLTVVLVGKDGGEKLRRVGGVAPREVFALIDSMPMRQAEMREGR